MHRQVSRVTFRRPTLLSFLEVFTPGRSAQRETLTTKPHFHTELGGVQIRNKRCAPLFLCDPRVWFFSPLGTLLIRVRLSSEPCLSGQGKRKTITFSFPSSLFFLGTCPTRRALSCWLASSRRLRGRASPERGACIRNCLVAVPAPARKAVRRG